MSSSSNTASIAAPFITVHQWNEPRAYRYATSTMSMPNSEIKE